MATIRWRIEDPADADPSTRVYTFPVNPNRMSSPFGERAVSYEGTTAVDGQPVMWEAQMAPKQMTFGGAILAGEQYEALRHWVFERPGRLFLFDHFGRRMLVTFTAFNPEPKRAVGRYWRHDYEITCWVYGVTAPIPGLA